MVAGPLFGLVVDWVGKRCHFLMAANAILIIAFTISLCLPNDPGSKMELLPLILIGIGYTFYMGNIWSCIPLVVKPLYLGTSYGLMCSLENLFQVLTPLLVAHIKDVSTNEEELFKS